MAYQKKKNSTKPLQSPQKPSSETSHTSTREETVEELRAKVAALTGKMRDNMKALILERSRRKKGNKEYGEVQSQINEGRALITNNIVLLKTLGRDDG